MNVPDGLRYSKDHEWVRVEGDVATVGITDYAQDALGDVVYVDPPALADGDGPVGAYRRWARQFYTNPASVTAAA